mgnify:CR=1 FL=1
MLILALVVVAKWPLALKMRAMEISTIRHAICWSIILTVSRSFPSITAKRVQSLGLDDTRTLANRMFKLEYRLEEADKKKLHVVLTPLRLLLSHMVRSRHTRIVGEWYCQRHT